MKRVKIILSLLIFTALFFVTGCNDKIVEDINGTVVVNMTDGPFNIEYIESAVVTVTSVEIRKAGDYDSVPFITLFKGSQSFDLLKLRNGLKEELLSIDIPVGTYNFARLYVSEAKLKIKDGGTFDVKIPGAQQTGIKIIINPALKIESGQATELLIDCDLSRSFILKGNLNKPDGINGFNFRPVVRIVNNSEAGTIEGMVMDITLKRLANAAVWIEKDSIIATAFTDSFGKYTIPGIPPGTYKMGAAIEKYDSLVFQGVKVFEKKLITRNFGLKPR